MELTPKKTSIVIISIWLLFLGCEEEKPLMDGPFYSAGTFAAPVFSDEILQLSDGLWIADHQLILLGKDIQLERLVKEIEGTGAVVIGQIPALGMLQVDVSTNTLEELEAKKLALAQLSNVAHVSFNYVAVPEYETESFEKSISVLHKNLSGFSEHFPCTPATDADLAPRDATLCNFKETEFFQALSLRDTLKARFGFALSIVNVGVSDNYFLLHHTEMDDVELGKTGPSNTLSVVTSNPTVAAMSKNIQFQWQTARLHEKMDNMPTDGALLKDWIQTNHGSLVTMSLIADHDFSFPGGLIRAVLKDRFNLAIHLLGV